MQNLRLEKINKSEWDLLFEESTWKNISQDWLFGEIKSRLNNAEVIRYKITQKEHVLCIFQVNVKKIPFLPLRLTYINRGPIFCRSSDDVMLMHSFKIISKNFSIFKGNFLIINPFLIDNLKNRTILKKAGLLGICKRTYITSNVNLNYDLAALRKGINSKWRNQLCVAEKSNLDLKTDLSGEYFGFVFEKYTQMTIDKRFKGLSINEVQLLFELYAKECRLFNFIAFDEYSKPIAYTVVLGYGKHAVYLMGWVDNEARKLNPSNLLLWSAIVHLKDLGYDSFDLGGIDPINLPGVARFKRGISGKEYVYTENWINSRLF
jgi:lipid II:glycine glycyltransferase (peptidoglycan interpeptide bridge formation enzyme)